MPEPELLTSIWDHLEDLRSALIRILWILVIGMGICLFFYQSIFQILTSGWQAEGISSNDLLIFGPMDGLVLTFKVCFWMSLALTSPLWGWVLMQFILPALKQKEKALIFPFLVGSFLCLTLGAATAYTITLPLSNRYLSAFNATIGTNAWALSHYIDYTLLLFTGHAVAFELGLILFMLVHVGWMTPKALIEKRRYMILLAFILGALLTPPDVASQVLLAIPLVILYELAIVYGKIRQKRIVT